MSDNDLVSVNTDIEINPEDYVILYIDSGNNDINCYDEDGHQIELTDITGTNMSYFKMPKGRVFIGTKPTMKNIILNQSQHGSTIGNAVDCSEDFTVDFTTIESIDITKGSDDTISSLSNVSNAVPIVLIFVIAFVGGVELIWFFIKQATA